MKIRMRYLPLVLLRLFALALFGSAAAEPVVSRQDVGTPPSLVKQTVAQLPGSESQGHALMNQLAVGTTICAVLTKSIDAKKAKAGDAISAKTTLPVLSHGKVLIFNGAKITGRITEVQAHSKGHPESEVGIVFDRVALKERASMPLALTVQAIGYVGLPIARGEDPGAYSPYVPTTSGMQGTSSPNARHSSVRPGSGGPDSGVVMPVSGRGGSEAARPVLDAGSKGTVGLPELTLTEGSDERGSVITSSRRNVKLDRGSELILRVTAKGVVPGRTK